MSEESDAALQARAMARFRASMNYWLATTMPDGGPHAAPIWGVWLDGAFWFGTAGQKARNLAHRPEAVVHLDSGDDVVMLRGQVEPVAGRAAIEPVADAFREKYVDGGSTEPYEMTNDVGEDGPVYRLTPEVGWAWLEGAFNEANTRWEFGGG